MLDSDTFTAEVRSRGIAFSITGWVIRLGTGTLYNPVMFNSIGGYGFFVELFFEIVYPI